jgi:hypothetical protein
MTKAMETRKLLARTRLLVDKYPTLAMGNVEHFLDGGSGLFSQIQRRALRFSLAHVWQLT